MPEDTQPTQSAAADVEQNPTSDSPPVFKELSEADMEKQCALKQEAAEALEDGNHEKALEKYNEAIKLGTDSALLYSRRAMVLLKLDRAIAAINDCSEALKINPDSAKAFKIRARAYMKLEKFVEAHMDFSTGQKIDYDDEIDDEVKDCAEKAKEGLVQLNKDKIEEGKRQAWKKKEEQRKAYEDAIKAREPEMRAARMEAETEKERQKNEVRNRNRARREEEEAKDKEEAEENDINCDSDEEESEKKEQAKAEE